MVKLGFGNGNFGDLWREMKGMGYNQVRVRYKEKEAKKGVNKQNSKKKKYRNG